MIVSNQVTHCIVCNNELRFSKFNKYKIYCSRKCNEKLRKPRQNNTYPYQKKRGLKRKLSLVLRFGGACSLCGYNKNLSALHFHHIDPKLKSFRLDARKLSNCTLEKIEEEVKKCQLLCANCHSEIHHPDLTIPLSPLL